MSKYNTLSFKKSAIIYIKNQYPKNSFYIITKGKAISYGTFDYSIEFNKGNILGLVNAILNEPYLYNVKAIEDTEVTEIKIDDIVDIENKELMVKIDKYLDTSLEMWLSKYYMALSDNKKVEHNKSIEDILEMAEIYKNNGFSDVSYKLYKKCLELFPENESEIKNKLSNLNPVKEPIINDEDNDYSYSKGYCIYTELEASDNLYIIKSGKVGIYNIVNSNQITRAIYSKNSIIDGYKPIGKFQALSTSVVVLENSIIKVLKREELLSIMEQERTLRLYYIRMVGMKIRNTIIKIIALNTDEIISKLIITLYYMLKTETLDKDISSIHLPYNIDDIKTMVNIDDANLITKELNKIKSINVSEDNYIDIVDIKSFIIEYKNCVNRITSHKN